jgi:hypothetical protein
MEAEPLELEDGEIVDDEVKHMIYMSISDL